MEVAMQFKGPSKSQGSQTMSIPWSNARPLFGLETKRRWRGRRAENINRARSLRVSSHTEISVSECAVNLQTARGGVSGQLGRAPWQRQLQVSERASTCVVKALERQTDINCRQVVVSIRCGTIIKDEHQGFLYGFVHACCTGQRKAPCPRA